MGNSNVRYFFSTKSTTFLAKSINSYPTHAYLVYKKDGKWNWFENCDKSNYGIHSYESLTDLITDQMSKHVKLASRFNPVDQDTLDLLHIYEYDRPKYGINTMDFKKFILNSEEVPIVD